MRNTVLNEPQAGIKIAKRNINNLRYSVEATLMAQNKDYGIQSNHFMANRWGNSGDRDRLQFFWVLESLKMVTTTMKLKDTCFLEEKL